MISVDGNRMTFLLLNQTFYPDLSATGQYLTDLAVGLSARGHQVTVIAARRAYTDPKRKFPKQEFWKGIRIWRVASTGFGKRTKCGRMVDALSFLFFCSLRVLISARPDIVVALTSPPLISFLAAVFSRFRRCKFCSIIPGKFVFMSSRAPSSNIISARSI